MGSFKDAVTPPYDVRVIAEAVVEEFGMNPRLLRVAYAVSVWEILPDDASPEEFEQLVWDVHRFATKII